MNKGFEPIIYEEPRILILGSLPSIKSFEVQEYYGNKQNRFWNILSKIFTMPIETYEQKKNILKIHHLALWDIAYSATRKGSSDMSMKDIQTNDIDGILKEYPTIKKICCTGKKAYELTTKSVKTKIHIVCLPSPSSANASYSLQALVDTYKLHLDEEI